jgi:polyisoprenoid-binding protein YceI
MPHLPGRRESGTQTLERAACGALLVVAVLAPVAVGAAGIGAATPTPEIAAWPTPTLDLRAGASWTIVEDESLFAVITRRGGPAARLAHDHLVHPHRYDARLELDPDSPRTAHLTLVFQVDDLVVDHPESQARVQGRLQELGILDGPFKPASASDREDIREEMLGPGQLDAANHPEIRVVTRSVDPDPDEAAAFLVRFDMTVKGITRETTARVRMLQPDASISPGGHADDVERLVLEGQAELRFTDFDIEPFRAFLGAVRNQDRFFLYLHLVLARDPPGGRW